MTEKEWVEIINFNVVNLLVKRERSVRGKCRFLKFGDKFD